MEPAFWDSSSLVALCVKQNASPTAEAMNRQYSQVVWWAAPVEMRGAFSRLARMALLIPTEQVGAQVRLNELRSRWLEILPGPAIRDHAERLVDSFPLKAADALQLAAALAWSGNRIANRTSERPHRRPFLSGDARLLAAAEELGFLAVKA